MKKFLLMSVFAVFVALQAHAAYEHPMDTMMKSWIGHLPKEAVKVWGNPTKIDYERGQTKYTWTEISSKFVRGTEFKQKTVCNRIFVTDTAGRIVFAKFTGDGCPFTTVGVNEKYPAPSNK